MADNRDVSARLYKWVIAQDKPPSVEDLVLCALAAGLSYGIGLPFRLQLTLSAAFFIAV